MGLIIGIVVGLAAGWFLWGGGTGMVDTSPLSALPLPGT